MILILDSQSSNKTVLLSYKMIFMFYFFIYITVHQMMRVDENGCFLQYKKNKNLVLYPELTVTEKKKKGDRVSWLPDPQGWVVTQV